MRESIADYGQQAVRNLAEDPRANNASHTWSTYRWFGTTGFAGTYSNVAGMTDGPLGGITTYKRKLWTSATTVAGSHIGDTGFDCRKNVSGVGKAQYWPCTPGVPVSASAYLRVWQTSGYTKPLSFSFYWVDSAGTQMTTTSRTNVSCGTVSSYGVWTRISATAIPPAGAAYFFACPDIGYTTSLNQLWLVGDMLDGTGLVINNDTAVVRPYSDGTYPGWKWTGLTDGSESVGFPYALESIAGRPAAINTVPGSTVAVPGTMGPMQGRTLYTIFDSLTAGAPTMSGPLGFLGTSNANQAGCFYVRYLPSANANLDSVIRPVSGVASFAQAPNAHALGRRISALTVTDGITNMSHCVDGAADVVTPTITAGTGLLTVNNLILDVNTVDYKPVAVYVFAAYHNRQTRLQVTAWLARKYGGTIPSGY